MVVASYRATQTGGFDVWGFLLVFYDNHRPKKHRFALGAWDRQTHGQTDRSRHRLMPPYPVHLYSYLWSIFIHRVSRGRNRDTTKRYIPCFSKKPGPFVIFAL